MLLNQTNASWWLYWQAVTIILKMVMPLSICSVCVALIVWRITNAHTARAALIHSSTISRKSTSSGGRNTKAMLLLSVYFVLCLPNAIIYMLSMTASMSCTMASVASLGEILSDSLSRNVLLSRIYDGIIFLVIPEYRTSIRKILHFSLKERAS